MTNKNQGWKKTKEAILSSGIPLEVSTCRKLISNDYFDFGEYIYERNEKPWSIDIHVSKYIDTPLISKQGQIELLVECKYRRQGKDWYFFSHPKGYISIDRENPTNILIDLPIKEIIWKNSRNKKDALEKYISNIISEFILYPKSEKQFLPIVSKSTELIKKVEKQKKSFSSNNNQSNVKNIIEYDENTQSLKYGIYQLRFGAASLLCRSYNYYSASESNLLYTILCPILVTTANLYYQNTNLSMEEFQKCKDFENVFTPVNYVIYHVPKDEELRNYTREKSDLKNITKYFNYAKSLSNLSFSLLEPNLPNCFFVVNYDKLDDFLSYLEKMIKNSIKSLLNNYPEIVERINKKMKI